MQVINTRRRTWLGTTMIELLVVIVIFAVGILAVLQIFPRGLQVIGITKSESMLRALVADEATRVEANPAALPHMILPIRYVWVSANNVDVVADSTRNVDELGPFTDRIDSTGQILDTNGNPLGNWKYLSGLNNTRRVVGEGGRIPAPRQVGALRGSLKILQFAPILYNPSFPNVLSVYGNDLVKRFGTPGGATRDYQCFLNNPDDSGGTIAVYRDPLRERRYRISMTAWVNNGTRIESREVVDSEIVVPAGAAGYQTFSLSSFAGLSGGETYLGSEFDSISVARKFLPVGSFSGDSDPYEYILLDEKLGLLLFKPTGYNVLIPRNNGQRSPLVARVNYDVYDWRIIKEDFRIPSSYPAEQHLRLSNIKHMGQAGPDQIADTAGLNVPVPDEVGGSENRDFILLDLDSGGVVSKNSIKIDYSGGVCRFIDKNNDLSDGLQIDIWDPGAIAARTINAEGHAVRALYMGTGEFAVQVTKAASTYRVSLGTPNSAECYAGGSGAYYLGSPLVPGESTVRIYFPPMDKGKKVTIGAIWYTDGGGNLKSMENQDFTIRTSPADTTVGLPYIDLRDYDSTAAAINYSQYGWGVRGVKGASITVRGVFNPNFFALTTDEAKNLEVFEHWMQAYRSYKIESFVQREAE